MNINNNLQTIIEQSGGKFKYIDNIQILDKRDIEIKKFVSLIVEEAVALLKDSQAELVLRSHFGVFKEKEK